MIETLFSSGVFTSQGFIPEAIIRVDQGRVLAVEPFERSSKRSTTLERETLITLPGFIDTHVHLDEPGRTHWEGITSGTTKAILGGVTTVLDMPIDSYPPTISEDDVYEKIELFSSKSFTNYGIFAGAIPNRLSEMKGAWRAGAVAFKGFLSPSGWDDFPPLDDTSLFEAMHRAKELGSTLALHAEDPACFKYGSSGVERTPESELSAVQKAIDGSMQIGTSIHLVHLSTSRAVELAHKIATVTTETCPHYFLDDRLLKEFGWSDIHVEPPVRDGAERCRLRDLVERKVLNVVASDHSPPPPQSEKLETRWAGAEGLGKTVLSLLKQFNDPALVAHYVQQSAQAFSIKNRGEIAPGNFADLITVANPEPGVWKIVDVIIKGNVVVEEGSIVGRSDVDNVALASEFPTVQR